MSGKQDRELQWKLVEHIVAALFDEPGVEIESNVRLPAIRRYGGIGGRREIDVLITGRLAGQRIQIPIECKHLRRKVGSPEIDAFLGKLMDTGLAPQASILVSTSGFTGGAVTRAQEVGMRTLVLTGANLSKTRNSILGAIQSHVYVACALSHLEFKTDGELDARDLLFFDASGNYKGSLPDFLWQAWVGGMPEAECGAYRYAVEIPSEWMHYSDGLPHLTRDIEVEMTVSAVVHQYRGEATWHGLTDARTNETERRRISLSFERANVEIVPTTFLAESALAEFLSAQPAVAKVTVGRIRLPKLLLDQGTLWPVPGHVLENLNGGTEEDMARDLSKYRDSAANNFQDFDEVHKEILACSQEGAWIRLIPLGADSDGC